MNENNNWEQYKYLNPIVTMESMFYEFSFTQQLQFGNYKIECYSVIGDELIRLVG
ncbi:MAG: hypothetical protein H8D94_00925 [Candidatus Pelagibacter sp.]|nr:hypothetical protein [Candidatus Pelagibacter sp.]